MRVIQQIFCGMLICGRKIVYNNSFFKVTNISKHVQNDYSDFHGLLCNIVFKEPFINQDISYINGNGVMKISTVSDYINLFW